MTSLYVIFLGVAYSFLQNGLDPVGELSGSHQQIWTTSTWSLVMYIRVTLPPVLRIVSISLK